MNTSQRRSHPFWLVLAAALLLQSAIAADYFVSPNGNGNGTAANPGSLLTACAHNGWASSIGAGDTIWLRGGLYQSPNPFRRRDYWEWVIAFSGAEGNPVTWRSYSNEWAVIDGCWDFGYNHYHRFRNLEFFDSHKATHLRTGYEGQDLYGEFNTSGSAGPWQEWINCVIRDTRLVWGAGGGWTVRGCIFWNIGQNAYEHVTYNASKYFLGNAVGWTAGTQINFTGDNHMLLASNILFGAWDRVARLENTDAVVIGNRFWPTHLQGTIGTLDLRNGSYTITNNTIIGDGWPLKVKDNPGMDFCWNTVMMANPGQGYPILENQGTIGIGNWIYDRNGYYARSPQSPIFRDAIAGQAEQNRSFSGWRDTYGLDQNSSAPGGLPPDSAHVIPNFDQPKRAHIAVYNWTRKDNVNVNVSGVLSPGEPYRLWSVQDFNHGPIQTGIVSGATISVPMTNLSVAAIPYGTNNTPHAAMNPEFGAFLLIGPTDPANPYPGGGSDQSPGRGHNDNPGGNGGGNPGGRAPSAPTNFRVLGR